MIDSTTLICTYCDERVSCHVSHDGYSGRCSCSTYFFQVGSGEKPVFWEPFADARKLQKFSVRGDNWDADLDGMSNETGECDVCGTTQCSDCLTVSFETVTVGGEELVKTTFECDADHKHYSNPLKEIAYYYPGEKGDFFPEELR